MYIWQDLWLLLGPKQRILYIHRTEFFDADFCVCMVDAAYAAILGAASSLDDMD